MEKMINNVKRKKRRTRRCLDEIRKRAHSSTCRSDSKVSSKENKNNVKYLNINSSKSSNHITIQRLTLFPKAIRSETVTRPLLLENNSNERFGKNIVHHKITLDQNTNEIHKTIDTKPVYLQEDFNCEVKRNNYEIDCERKNETYFSNGSSPSSFVLFSPINDCEKSQNVQSTSLSNVSSPSSQDDYSYLLYEELMNEIPIYLKHNVPSIMNEDVIADTKSYLRNLFMEDSSHSSAQDDDNLYISDNTIHSSPGEILQNPKDYLRQCFYEHNITCGEDDKESDSLPHTSKISLPRQSQCSPQAPVNGHTQSIIQITPEYNYYPHKLNE